MYVFLHFYNKVIIHVCFDNSSYPDFLFCCGSPTKSADLEQLLSSHGIQCCCDLALGRLAEESLIGIASLCKLVKVLVNR